MWNGIGWYGFIGPTTSTTDISLHLRVTLNLTSDLVLKIIVSGAYLLYYLREESQFRCADAG